MKSTDFTDTSAGRLISNLEGRLTFVPNDLPPETQFPILLLKQAEEVGNALGRLDGYASGLPDSQILIRSFVRREAVSESAAKLSELNDLRNQYHQKVLAARGTAIQLRLVDHLFVSPVITTTDAAGMLGISYEAARLNVQKLVDFMILSVYKPGKPTHYIAETILKAVNPDPTRR